MAIFEPLDDEWQSTTRSIRIDGTVTSVRLENFYWRVVGEIARRNGLQIPQLMTSLSKAAKSGETKHSNFTSFIRVCCGRYLDGEIARRNDEAEGFSGKSQAPDSATRTDAAPGAINSQLESSPPVGQNNPSGSTASSAGIRSA